MRPDSSGADGLGVPRWRALRRRRCETAAVGATDAADRRGGRRRGGRREAPELVGRQRLAVADALDPFAPHLRVLRGGDLALGQDLLAARAQARVTRDQVGREAAHQRQHRHRAPQAHRARAAAGRGCRAPATPSGASSARRVGPRPLRRAAGPCAGNRRLGGVWPAGLRLEDSCRAVGWGIRHFRRLVRYPGFRAARDNATPATVELDRMRMNRIRNYI